MANKLVTNRAEAPAKDNREGKQVASGQTCGYRDVKGGGIERRNFNDGHLPKGWVDSPTACKNEWDGKPIPLV